MARRGKKKKGTWDAVGVCPECGVGLLKIVDTREKKQNKNTSHLIIWSECNECGYQERDLEEEW